VPIVLVYAETFSAAATGLPENSRQPGPSFGFEYEDEGRLLSFRRCLPRKIKPEAASHLAVAIGVESRRRDKKDEMNE